MRTVEETRKKIKEAIQKQIDSGETINIRKIARDVGASQTTAGRVFSESFKDNPNAILGKNRDATKIIDKIISEGETDIDKIKKIALNKYKINVADRTIQQKVNIATDLSVPEYEDILKNIVNDKTYKPPIDISAAGKGLTANYRQAKTNLKEEIPNLQTFIDQSSAKRKKLTRAENPEKREMDLVSAQMRRDKRRFSEKGKIGLSERELDLNKQQRTVLKRVNDIINNNPEAILEDKELLDKISTRVDREGNIYKAKIDLSAVIDPKKDARFFNLSHGKRVQLGGELLNAPANRFAAPFSLNQFFIPDAEKFIEKNYDNPEAQTKINDIVEKAKELKVPLRPDVPKGIFKNEAGNSVRFIGYTENLGKPVEKIMDVVKTYTPKKLNKLTLPILAGTALVGTAQAKTPTGEMQTAMQDQTAETQPEQSIEQQIVEATKPKLYFDKDLMTFMKDPETPADQSDKLFWLADNPIAEHSLAITAGLTAGLAIPGAKETYEASRAAGRGPTRSAAGVALKGLGRAFTPLPVAAMDAAEIGSRVAKGESASDILTSPSTYMNLAFLEGLPKTPGQYPSAGALGKVKDFFNLKNVSATAEPGIMSAALRMGLNPRVIAGAGRFLGIPGLIASSLYTGYDMYNEYKENKKREELGLPND
jgi:AraC-like DNA-binding protein